jgi:hypothetical protein
MQTSSAGLCWSRPKWYPCGRAGGTIYVNFGRPFTRDFAVLQAAFRAAGRDPFGFTGRQLRVRGFLERRTGTVIEAMAPEQMELLD